MLNNHLRFTVLYRWDPPEGRAQIVEWSLSCVKHSYVGAWNAEGALQAQPQQPLCRPFTLRIPLCSHAGISSADASCEALLY